MSEKLADMTDEELAELRAKLDADIEQAKQVRRAVVEEHQNRLLAQQVKARYGEAGAVLLEVMTPRAAAAELAKRRAEGKAKDSGTVVSVDKVATSELGVAPLKTE